MVVMSSAAITSSRLSIKAELKATFSSLVLGMWAGLNIYLLLLSMSSQPQTKEETIVVMKRSFENFVMIQ